MMNPLIFCAGIFLISACAPLPPKPIAITEAQSSSSTDYLVEEALMLNSQCRGGSGDKATTWRACEKRDAAFDHLRAQGICDSRPGDAGYEYRARFCGS